MIFGALLTMAIFWSLVAIVGLIVALTTLVEMEEEKCPWFLLLMLISAAAAIWLYSATVNYVKLEATQKELSAKEVVQDFKTSEIEQIIEEESRWEDENW